MERIVTYSKSSTLILTSYCANSCLYCGFRQSDGSFVQDDEIEETLSFAAEKGCSEILVMSGENVDKNRKITEELKEKGYNSFIDFAVSVCQRILSAGMLPHTNIGVVSYDDLVRLRKVNASMGLMIENANSEFAKKVNPQKRPELRFRMLEDAGRLKIPFTTGILVGLGETQEDRIDSLKRIIDCHSKYDHIQEVIIQNFVPNSRSALKSSYPLSFDEYVELIEYVRRNSDIAVQIPQNLNPFFADLIEYGLTDIGGISEGRDRINPENPWARIDELKKIVAEKGALLKRRLPIYPKYIDKGWYSDEVGEVISKLLKMTDDSICTIQEEV